jgi:transcription-repair coupling factor (superfamily II helicase)
MALAYKLRLFVRCSSEAARRGSVLELAQIFAEDKDFRTLAEQIAPMRHDGLVTGISGSARHLAMTALYIIKKAQKGNAALLVVTHSASQAEEIWGDIREFLPDEQVLLFPEREMSFADAIAFSPDVIAMRLHALQQLTASKSCIVVTTGAALAQPVVRRDLFHDNLVTFTVGKEVSLDNVIEKLIRGGYERVDLVESRGHFSIRGGIIDIFPLTEPQPFRIELFDTDVDSIRDFDIATQRSHEKYQEISIVPAFDFLVPSSVMQKASVQVEKLLQHRIRTVTDVELKERMQSRIGEDIRKLSQGIPFYGQLRYAQLFEQFVSTVLDYCPESTVVCLDEPSRLQERERALEREFGEWLSTALIRGDVLSGTTLNPNYRSVWDSPKTGRVQFSTFARPTGNSRFAAILNVSAKSMQSFHGQMNVLKGEISRWQKSGMHVLFLAATEERALRLDRVLKDYRIEVDFAKEFVMSKIPQIMVGNISAGFELPMQRLVVVVDTEVFAARKKSRRARLEMSDAERIKSYQDLREGDYVVHVNHGIGRYAGIRTLEIEGKRKDYLHLTYAGNDSLYVPVEQIDQVQKYVGSEDKEPKLYHLGGGDWNRVKQKVSKTVRDIAEELVKLYAEREATPGHAFGPDTPWQKDFEAMFPYEETPDQLRAISDIKRDMERSRPMDRLLCGDVGYGKTEVAVRAAFKSAMDGKQVAILVPTTVLAQQHFETFKERFSGFPITVEVLSRFRSRKEAQACVKGLKDGSVDIVIGTHRLLQKSIQFKDLGLLIVDEEQRFGVTHKERLKQMKSNVDCLTLTATPIPRTLHMSMIGVRDLSIIETPPENRFPVQTYVVEFNEGLIREALERELGRGGQVYFLHNQVQNIRTMADRLHRLVGDARIEVAHGQLAEEELERVMLDFLDGDIDILVTTTIIETGLDIPNVNTLIVNDADRLGLSQLYQLRGRVGRSNRIAYSYFMYQKDKVLSEVAEKRLQAIKEFTELGSGFKIAMRDLSIRGAGNLLGAEQHGFINSVGFDMYSEMLSQAVKEIRGEKREEEREVQIDIPIDAYLPDGYISDPAQKIAMYKKFKHVHNKDAADDLEEELVDRYGDLPQEVRNLLDITRLKSYASRGGADVISRQGAETTVRFPVDTNVPVHYSALLSCSLKHAGQLTRRPNGITFVSFKTRGMSDLEILKKLIHFLSDYVSVLQEPEEVEEFAK